VASPELCWRRIRDPAALGYTSRAAALADRIQRGTARRPTVRRAGVRRTPRHDLNTGTQGASPTPTSSPSFHNAHLGDDEFAHTPLAAATSRPGPPGVSYKNAVITSPTGCPPTKAVCHWGPLARVGHNRRSRRPTAERAPLPHSRIAPVKIS